MALKTPARFNGMDAFFLKMVRKFVDENLRQPWLDFDEAVKDVEKFKAHVHTIKGVAGNLDVTSVYEAAIALENTLREGAPDKELYLKLIAACDALREEADKA